MDYFFNKTLSGANYERAYQEDLTRSSTQNFQKSLSKSKSSNELTAKKSERENAPANIYLNTWGYNKHGQLGNSSAIQKTSQLNLIKYEHSFIINLIEESMILLLLYPQEKITLPSFHVSQLHPFFIIIEKLKVYVSGANNFGQLGIEDVINAPKFTLLPVRKVKFSFIS